MITRERKLLAANFEASRVAVITSESRPTANVLWYGVTDQVEELRVIGSPYRGTEPLPSGQVTLPIIRFGRGQTKRHLVGLGSVLDAFGPDVIHVNDELWGITCQELLGRAEAVVVHGAENIWNHGRRVTRLLRARLVSRAVHRISGYGSWNESGARHVARLAPRGLPTLVLPAIIPPLPFRRVRWTPPPPAAPFRILLVGALTRQKGFDTVIRAVGSLPTRDKYLVTLCGEGELDAELTAQACDRGVLVDLLGRVGPHDLAQLMATSSCLVQPSVTTPTLVEQFGRSVAEAMVVGLPCLVSSSGELPRVVGDAGAIFPENDHGTLARRLEDLRTSPAELATLGQAQRRRSELWSVEYAGPLLRRFWSDAIRWRRHALDCQHKRR